jgi:anti-sigma regulatory factor (Ser/Thr protein kinase)
MSQRYPARQRHAPTIVQVTVRTVRGTPREVSLAEQEAALDVTARAVASQIPAMRRAVGEAARRLGAGDERLLQVNLAVTEALTNVVQHAYRDRTDADVGDVRVLVGSGDGRRLVVRVQDSGIGPAPRPDSPGLGLGLCLMAHETARFEIGRSPDGGTEVVLHFRL